jgi:aldehyde dehydrogenase (NAD+)
VAELKKAVEQFYGPDPKASDNFARIVTTRHFDRVLANLTEPHGGQVLLGGPGQADRAAKYIPPTIVLNPAPASRLLTEEIFGPILPVITVPDLEHALRQLKAQKEAPLANYIFAQDPAAVSRFVHETRAGGTCVNDAGVHSIQFNLPFGGLGPSGMGRYRGKYSFLEFSHLQSVLFRTTPDMPTRFPPHSPKKLAMVTQLLKSAL